MGRKLVLILCLATSLCFGCNKSESDMPAQSAIQIALTQDMLSFDPVATSDIFSEAILRCVYTSLYDFDEKLGLRPKLVKSESKIDERTWRLEIHDHVTFHDGSRLTTDDVLFTIKRARTGARTQKLLEPLDSVEKVSDTVFIIRSKEPYADFLSLFAKAETSIVSKNVVENSEYDFKIPVGAGPFMLRERVESQRVSLERFDNYYLTKAATQNLNFVVMVTEQERTASFLKGEVDILFSVSAYDCESLRLSQNVKLLQVPSTKIEYLSLNNHRKPLDNTKVRQAISYAINRQNIVNNVYHGYATPSSSLIPHSILGYVDNLVTYDPQKAKALLKEAGLEGGFSFNVIAIDTIRKNTLEYIKLDLAEVGIQLNYNLVTMKEAAGMMMAGEHDAILVGWAYNADPNGVLPLLLGTGSGKSMNSSNYSNSTVDALITDGRQATDRDRKQRIYEQINTIVTGESPIVVLLNPMILAAARDSIEGIHLNPQGLFQYESLSRK